MKAKCEEGQSNSGVDSGVEGLPFAVFASQLTTQQGIE